MEKFTEKAKILSSLWVVSGAVVIDHRGLNELSAQSPSLVVIHPCGLFLDGADSSMVS